MKQFIFVALIFSCTVSRAQLTLKDEVWKKDTSRHIPKDVTTIFVKNVTFKNACDALLDAGLEIDKKDNELETVTTLFKKIEGAILGQAWEPVITIRIKDNNAIITQRYFAGDFFGWQPGMYQEKNGKPKQNAVVYAFMQAFIVAKKLGHIIEFTKAERLF